MEVLLAGATVPAPPPLDDLVEPDLLDQVPADVTTLLSLLPQADLYLQDEVQLALHPTLTRTWCRRGRAGQRRVEAPGSNEKVYGFGLVDWRDGWFHGLLAEGRTAGPFCEQLSAAVARSRERGRVAIVICDNLSTHTARGSLKVRQLLASHAGQLHLVYTPAYDPEANRIEWLWRIVRRSVTHNHWRQAMSELVTDATEQFRELTENPAAVLRHIGGPLTVIEPPASPLRLAA